MNLSDSLIEKLTKTPVVPVVALETVDQALNVVRALNLAGVNCIEVTFRTEAAPECIRVIKELFPEMILIAGTILSLEQAELAIAVGADIIVSPALNEEVVRFCLAEGVPIIPGVCNPQQVEQGIALGLSVLKFFPASVFGGVNFLKAIAPIYKVQFMPTGGITAETWRDYLALPNVVCCGGSWIASGPVITGEHWKEVESRARETLT